MTSRNKAGKSSRFWLFLAAVLAAVPWFSGSAAGERQIWIQDGRAWPFIQPAEQADDVSSDGLNNEIRLNEPEIEGEELAACLQSALSLQKRGQWGEALKAYYTIIDSPVDYLCRQPDVDEGRVYIGMKEFCRRQMELFSAEGRRAYRLRYDNAVRKMLEKAAGDLDLATLRLIDFNYSLSSYGDDAVMLAADILYEEGSLNEAFYYYDRLIRRYPDTNTALEMAYARLGRCAMEIGPEALPRLAEHALPAALEKCVIAVAEGGRMREMGLGEYLAEVCAKLRRMDPGRVETSPVSPEMFRNLRLRYKIDSPTAAPAWNAEIYGESLFVDPVGSPQGITVYDVKTGKVVNVLGYIRSQETAFSSEATAADEVWPLTVSEDGGRYYAVMPQNLQPVQTPGYCRVQRWATRLQAFDRRTNKIVWWWRPEQVTKGGVLTETSSNDAARGATGEDCDFMGQSCLASAPVRYGAYLYAGAVRITTEGTQEFYVTCFDPLTGALKWRSLIGSLSPTTVVMDPGGRTMATPVAGSRICAANDTIFFTSNMGVAGAVNSVTGDVKWVAKYHRPAASGYGNQMYLCAPPFIWHESPPAFLHNVRRKAADGSEYSVSMLVVAPRDSDCLYSFDPETGKRMWEVPALGPRKFVTAFEPPRALAIVGDKAVIFQSAVNAELRQRYENDLSRIPEFRGGGFGKKTGKDAVSAEKVLTIDLATGKRDSFGAYLGENEVLIGRPTVIGGMLFLLVEQTFEDRASGAARTTRSLIGYNTAGNDKVAVWEDVTEVCGNRRINKFFITNEGVIFICDGAIYACGPAGGET